MKYTHIKTKICIIYLDLKNIVQKSNENYIKNIKKMASRKRRNSKYFENNNYYHNKKKL